MYCFVSLFSLHIFQSFPNRLPFTLTLPTLHCYLKLFLNPKSKLRRPLFQVLQKPWKSLIPRGPLTTTHRRIKTLLRYTNTVWSRVFAVLCFLVWLYQRYAHFYFGCSLDQSWWYATHTHTQTHAGILSCPAQCYILWFSSKGDRKSMPLLLTSENAPHL